MAEIRIKTFDERVSKKGTRYWEGACRMAGDNVVKWFFTFDEAILGVGPEGGTIKADVERTARDDKIRILNINPGVAGHVKEMKKLDAEAGLEKRLTVLESRLKNLEMAVADIDLGRTRVNGA